MCTYLLAAGIVDGWITPVITTVIGSGIVGLSALLLTGAREQRGYRRWVRQTLTETKESRGYSTQHSHDIKEAWVLRAHKEALFTSQPEIQRENCTNFFTTDVVRARIQFLAGWPQEDVPVGKLLCSIKKEPLADFVKRDRAWEETFQEKLGEKMRPKYEELMRAEAERLKKI